MYFQAKNTLKNNYSHSRKRLSYLRSKCLPCEELFAFILYYNGYNDFIEKN